MWPPRILHYIQFDTLLDCHSNKSFAESTRVQSNQWYLAVIVRLYVCNVFDMVRNVK